MGICYACATVHDMDVNPKFTSEFELTGRPQQRRALSRHLNIPAKFLVLPRHTRAL